MHPEKGPAVEHTAGPEECGLFVAGEVGDAVKALLQVGIGGDAVGHLAVVEQWVRANEKHPETYVSRCYFLVGAGGFEPPKLKAADLQSVPIGHSGTRPYSFLRVRSPDDLLILAWEMDFVNCFLLFSSKVFCTRRRRGAAMRLALCENGGYPSFLPQKYLPDKRQIRRLRIAFCAILCYNSGRTEQKTAGAFCRFARWEG